MRLTFLGGAGTVTGSKTLVDGRVLVDCGLFQGWKPLRLRNWAPLPVAAKSIEAVLLTHAHIDHSGYLPLLCRNGFAGPIYCTRATADLCAILLRDAAHLQEEEADFANRHGYSKHHPALPLYDTRDAEQALARLSPLELDRELEVAGLRARFREAGHLLGAATIQLEGVVFSGDLGRPADPLAVPPARIGAAETLVLESTYGDRVHESGDPMQALGEVVRRTAERGGVVVIPSFAVGRAQIVLHFLMRLRRSGAIPQAPVFLNSPMADAALEVFRNHLGEHRLTAADTDAIARGTEIVRDVEASKRLNQRPGPMVIVAGSGMASGGRVLHHLRAFAPDAKNTILFVGFQAPGTRGADLVAGRRSLRMHGDWIDVRAEVDQLPNLSAHADAAEIVGWLRGFERPPRRVLVNHGEPAASEALRRRIQRELGWRCDVPDYLETIEV